MSEKQATEYITITVAEYHCLTKAATWLEVILNAKDYERDTVARAVQAAMADMLGTAGAGAEE